MIFFDDVIWDGDEDDDDDNNTKDGYFSVVVRNVWNVHTKSTTIVWYCDRGMKEKQKLCK